MSQKTIFGSGARSTRPSVPAIASGSATVAAVTIPSRQVGTSTHAVPPHQNFPAKAASDVTWVRPTPTITSSAVIPARASSPKSVSYAAEASASSSIGAVHDAKQNSASMSWRSMRVLSSSSTEESQMRKARWGRPTTTRAIRPNSPSASAPMRKSTLREPKFSSRTLNRHIRPRSNSISAQR